MAIPIIVWGLVALGTALFAEGCNRSPRSEDQGGEGEPPAAPTPPPQPPAVAQATPPPVISSTHQTELGLLGFRDADGDGIARWGEQDTYETLRGRNPTLHAGFMTKQERAFHNLASAGDSRFDDVVDDTDFVYQTDPRVLAELMRNDPEYDVLTSGGALERGRNQVNETFGHGSILPEAYRRVMIYCQRGLNDLLPSHADTPLTPNGVYGPTTARLIQAFQGNAGIVDDRRGGAVGPVTYGAMILYLETNPQAMLEELIRLRGEMVQGTRVPFRIGDDTFTLSRIIVGTLQYLYPQEIPAWRSLTGTTDSGATVVRPTLRQAAEGVLEHNFGGVTIGPNVLAQLIAQLQARMRTAQAL